MENGLNDESRISRVARENGARNHDDSFKRKKVNGGIDALIRQLINTPIGRAPARESLLELFGNRASYAAITQWRFGWKSPPPWASDLLRSKITARQQELERAKATIPRRGPGPGERGTRNLAAWRERKAREKEKAASEAALKNE